MTKKSKIFVYLGAALIPVFAGCASNPVVTAPVGPGPVEHSASNANSDLKVTSDTEDHVASGAAVGRTKGYVQVFSATQKSLAVSSEDSFHSDQHTGYEIYGSSGDLVKLVANHLGDMDEWPDTVALSPGAYKIVAQSSRCGLVAVPVVIQGGKTTIVHLDDNWFPATGSGTNRIVCLPNGEPIGWRVFNPGS
jgi:hypothetical protein